MALGCLSLQDACPDGYYKNGTGKLGRRCLTCPAGISKCISPTVATECRDAKYLTTHGACVDACPDGTYPTGHSSIGRTCQASSCCNKLACVGPLQSLPP
ncbi:unnamed protein product [Durusdinium trenchii]|uniref:Uncharacterized protein n=1 Tax=Durusdinium trenchii TaxID=1381693 RepID=A0ABP0NY11_9DINO